MPNISQSMSRGRFLREYEYGAVKEFERDGKAAQWAQSPRIWGQEDDSIELTRDDPNKSNEPSLALAISHDSKYLAVSTNAVIRIYHLDTKRVTQALVGHPGNVQTLHFAPATGSEGMYLLLSGGAEFRVPDGDIIQWTLDAEGRHLDRKAMPFAVDHLADKAFGAIAIDLVEHHDLNMELRTIRNGFASALASADTTNRMKYLPQFRGQFPKYHNPRCLTKDGRKVLWMEHNGTTQNGMRPPDLLPQIVVYDLVEQKELHRLKGPTDAIMWVSWSPDDKTIALASWDETYSIFRLEPGAASHVIGPTGGQNWAGGFSPDSKHVILSGGHPTVVGMYDVVNGKEVARLDYPLPSPSHWVREFAWSPDGENVAVVIGHSVVLWQPFKGTTQEVFKLKNDGSMLNRFCELSDPKWVDSGKKLVFRTSEDTVLVWDPHRNVKWRFQRPKGTPLRTGGDELIFMPETQTLMSLDGDFVIREWQLD